MYHERMDIGIWWTTIILEVAILAGLLYRRWLIFLVPIFSACIAINALESLPLMIYHDSDSYYYVYYAIDLLNVALYIAAAYECWCKGYFSIISVSMTIYLSFKACSYALLMYGYRDASLALHAHLRYMNLACYIVWALTVWGYDVFGTKSKTTR